MPDHGADLARLHADLRGLHHVLRQRTRLVPGQHALSALLLDWLPLVLALTPEEIDAAFAHSAELLAATARDDADTGGAGARSEQDDHLCSVCGRPTQRPMCLACSDGGIWRAVDQDADEE